MCPNCDGSVSFELVNGDMHAVCNGDGDATHCDYTEVR